MPSVIICPACGRKLKVPEGTAGKRFKCPQCGGVVPATGSQETCLGGQGSKAEAFGVQPLTPPKERLVPLLDDDEAPADRRPARGPRLRRRHAPDPDDVVEEEDGPPSSRAAISLGIASLVVGLAAFVFPWIPGLGILGLAVSGLGLLLGLVGAAICWSRQGGGIGFAMAGSAVSLLALTFSGAWLVLGPAGHPAAKDVVRQEPAPVKPIEEASAKPPAPVLEPDKDAEWVDITRGPVVRGDIGIQVGAVRHDFVMFDDVLEKRRSPEMLLTVPLIIKNLSATRKIDYQGWANVFGQKGYLTDNFGNVYKPFSFGLGTHIVGQVDAGTSIYPGKQIEDLLVFELPVQNVQYLRLELPASAFGGQGTLRLHIPTAGRR